MKEIVNLYDAHGDIWYDVLWHSEMGERDIFRKYQLPKFKKGGVFGGTFVMWIDRKRSTSGAFGCI